MKNFLWTCPFCNPLTTITGNDISFDNHYIYLEKNPALLALQAEGIQ